MEDNVLAIMMSNCKKPTYRYRLVDTNNYPLQDFVDQVKVIIQYIVTNINSYNVSTKEMGWVLHGRLTIRLKGNIDNSLWPRSELL